MSQSEIKKLTPQELEQLQALQKEHTVTRLRIADFEIKKNSYIGKEKVIASALLDLEIELSNKYGIGIAINSTTGEITKKR